jgi:hypothetical protein
LEEPTERHCPKLKIYGCNKIFSRLLEEYRISLYAYNSRIRETGFYLKPVHKVYYTRKDGTRSIYEYYGTYWWIKKKKGYKTLLKYYGKNKPPGLPDPPINPLSGIVANPLENWVIVPIESYRTIASVVAECKVECVK